MISKEKFEELLERLHEEFPLSPSETLTHDSTDNRTIDPRLPRAPIPPPTPASESRNDQK